MLHRRSSRYFQPWVQLRDIPVIYSNVGGIPEVKLGIPHIIPVNVLIGERIGPDNYVVPGQDIDPWLTTLDKLMTDKEEYERLPQLARDEIVEWLQGLDHTTHEAWLMTLKRIDL